MRRRTSLRALMVALPIALAAGCTSTPPGAGDAGGTTGTGGAALGDAGWDPDADAVPTFTWLYDNIFHGYCADRNQPCHNPGMNRGVSFASRERAFDSVQLYIVPGDAFASDLYYLISAGIMPPINPQVPAELQAALQAWLDAGAQDN